MLYVSWIMIKNTMVAIEADKWEACFDAELLSPGQHLLTVIVKDDMGNVSTVAIPLQYPLTQLTLTAEPSSVLANTPVKLTASAMGGNVVEYKFTVSADEGDSWMLLQNFSTLASCLWTPNISGAYLLKCISREQGGQLEISDVFAFVVKSPLTGVSLEANIASPQAISATIDISANADGGNSVEYEFQLDCGAGWETVQEYSLSSLLRWQFSAAGNYGIRVNAREEGSALPVVSATLPFTITIPAALQDVSISTQQTSPCPQYAVIHFDAVPTGGSNVEYSYSVYNGAAWQLLRDYSPESTYSWSSDEPGTYTIQVSAREKGATTTVTDSLQYVITQAQLLTGIALNTSLSSPQPAQTRMLLTAFATNGIQVVYRFEVHNGTDWITLRGDHLSDSCSWTPQVAGNYLLRVTAYESGEAQTYTADIPFTISLPGPLASVALNSDIQSPQLANTMVTFSAEAEGGDNIEYQYMLDDGGGWQVIRGYSNDPGFSWTPAVAGCYNIQVSAREVGTTEEFFATSCYSIGTSSQLAGVVLSLSPKSPQGIGTTITLQGNPIFGNDIEYSFAVSDGQFWTPLQNFSFLATCDWIPTLTGTYSLRAIAREAGTTTEFSHDLDFTVLP